MGAVPFHYDPSAVDNVPYPSQNQLETEVTSSRDAAERLRHCRRSGDEARSGRRCWPNSSPPCKRPVTIHALGRPLLAVRWENCRPHLLSAQSEKESRPCSGVDHKLRRSINNRKTVNSGHLRGSAPPCLRLCRDNTDAKRLAETAYSNALSLSRYRMAEFDQFGAMSYTIAIS